MSPTIVLDPAGKLLLVVGAAGGPRIITATSQVVLNVIEHRMSLADAMRAPRLHHQALPDTLPLRDGGPNAGRDGLAARDGLGRRVGRFGRERQRGHAGERRVGRRYRAQRSRTQSSGRTLTTATALLRVRWNRN